MTGSKDNFTADFSSASFGVELRAKGLESIADLPVPTRKSERWKYSQISKLVNSSLHTCTGEGVVWPQEILPNPIPFLESYRMVFRNGTYVASLSDLPVADGIVCAPLSSIDLVEFTNSYHKKEWIGAVNAAYHQDGLFLSVEKGVVLDRPLVVHNLFDGEDVASFPRHFISIGEGAEAEVIMWSSATEKSSGMNNGILEAHVSANAQLTIDKVCNESGEVFHFSHEHIVQDRDSRVKTNTFTVKGHWVRNELEIVANGAGTDSVFNGAYLPTGSEHVDNHTTMDHAFPNGTSSELYRGIMYGKSTGVFNGKIFVRKDAQKTNAFQQNSNIVADKGATINAKPELEIYADDVKCSHGCTVGQFDTEALFYLKSRGLDTEAAKALLVKAYVSDVLNSVEHEEVRNEILKLYSERHGWS
jgi:Fe-S cluster assembly protein SufD